VLCLRGLGLPENRSQSAGLLQFRTGPMISPPTVSAMASSSGKREISLSKSGEVVTVRRSA
jgi:hypothetical protein